MALTLSFTTLFQYDTGKTGISVPVKLQSGDETVICEARLDTGASCCIFERAQGRYLGLDIESGARQEFSTPTGSFIAYGHEITLSVLGLEVATTAYFAANENFTRNVLGRQGWLDRVCLGLVDYEGKLYLRAYDETV